jgi:hypothetical protein
MLETSVRTVTDIWIGLAEVVPTGPAGSAMGGAHVHVLAPADDRLDLLAAAESLLGEHDLRVVELDDAEPLRRRLGHPLDPALVELALEAALERDTRLGPFHWYPIVRDTDPAALAPSTMDEPRTTLGAAQATRTLVKVRSRYEHEGERGYVVGLGLRWALIQLVSDDLTDDGFLATSLEMLAEIEVIDPDESFFPRFMEMHPLAASPPRVDLDDTRDLLQSAHRQFPLVNIETEEAHPGSCYIGRITSLDDDGVVLELVTPAGEWDEEEHYPYESITRIGFGGRYEEALAIAAGARRT